VVVATGLLQGKAGSLGGLGGDGDSIHGFRVPSTPVPHARNEHSCQLANAQP
jgi:hypothetical protein